MKVKIPTDDERLEFFAPKRDTLALDEVAEIIAPVVPEHLAHEGRGVYTACWRDAVSGAGEIVKLCGMRSRVVVISERPHRPDSLPDGIGVRFCIIPLVSQSSELEH